MQVGFSQCHGGPSQRSVWIIVDEGANTKLIAEKESSADGPFRSFMISRIPSFWHPAFGQQTLCFCDASKLPCVARSRAAAKASPAEPCGLESTRDTVLHAHQAVVSTPTERTQTCKKKHVQKICPSDGLFRSFERKKPKSEIKKKIC